ncbi:Protein HOS4 [Symbiodinium microadriaticum]|uniref:Protein HOS4 n=1 Tax=Symbiodinium microadriaticum TaxID=2951 RepID=A0A1Q9D2M8_SYMMI|nr:Protein HOS4 [Symbiodinium microadriaticum]
MVDKANDCGDTALHAAAWQGHVDAVEQLVVAGAIISKANADGDAPLHVAAQRGHVKVVHFLIDQQADLAKRNVEGATALEKSGLLLDGSFGAWLGGLLRVGCRLSDRQVSSLARRVSNVLAEASGSSMQSALAFASLPMRALAPAASD